MASYTTRPNRQEFDLDPYEQLSKVLEHASLKPYLPPGIEMPDLLTFDIEKQLVEQSKMAELSEGWLDSTRKDANKIMDQLEIDQEKYELWIGHQSWAEQWAAPVELRIKESNLPVQVSSSLAHYDLVEIIKHLYKCAEKEQTVKPDEGSENKKVFLLVYTRKQFNGELCFERIKLLANCSIVDERFGKLFTILRIWKEREFDKIDTKGAFSLYAFALMLVHFLRVGCQPPVLPPLYNVGVLNSSYGLSFPVGSCDTQFKSENKKSLGNLLFNFFNYYETTLSGGFDFMHWKISVREGKAIKLDEPSKTFYIEDPLYVASVNIVDESKSPGISHMLSVMFMQCRARLMKDRRLHQLENFILA